MTCVSDICDRDEKAERIYLVVKNDTKKKNKP